jgi:hypothetical protein
VDGVNVPAFGGTLAVTGPVDLDQAASPGHPSSAIKSFHLATAAQDVSDSAGQAFQLVLGAVEHPGDERLQVTVSVTEQFATVAAYSSYTMPILHTHDVRYEPQFYTDRAECLKRLNDLMHKYTRFKHIIIAFTLPDPPPDFVAAARLLEEVQRELAQVAEAEPQDAHQLAEQLGRGLHVSPRFVLPERVLQER